MINIFVSIEVCSSNRTVLLEKLAALTAASQKETGCNRYQYYFHPTDQTKVVIVEQWQNAEVLAAHEASEHFTTLLPQIGELAFDVKIEKF